MVVSQLIQSIIDMPGEINEVAMQGPVEAVLVTMGALLIALPMIALVILVIGAVVDLVWPESFGATYP